jgi:predicted DNA-binding helix-hairpin-helix protein
MFEVFANSKNPSEIGRHLQWIILTICESTQDFRKEQVQRSKSLATRQLLVRAAAL